MRSEGELGTLRFSAPSVFHSGAFVARVVLSGALAAACTCDSLPPVETNREEVRTVETVLRTEKPSIPPEPSGCLGKPASAAPATQPLPGGGAISVRAYGRDLTDGSSVSWNQSYPSPCLDDRPPRLGFPNAAWHADYSVEGDEVCFFVKGLYTHYGPKNRLQIGYTVSLTGGAAFEDGKRRKDVVVYEFIGVPNEQDSKKCLKLRSRGAAASASAVPSQASSVAKGESAAKPNAGKPSTTKPSEGKPSGTAK
jgi:hypothetical protein